MKTINRLLLHSFGYKIDTVNIPPEAKKCVLLFAPHTSMTDFLIGRMSLSAMGVKTVFLIKKEAFWFPLGNILRALGGLPIDRKHVRNFTQYASDIMKNHEEIAFLISPEGTRSLNPNWKKGFYYIAQKANVPIVLGYLDYHTKRGGMGPAFYPTGDYEKDIQEISKFYYGMRGLHRGKFNLEKFPYAHPEWRSKKN